MKILLIVEFSTIVKYKVTLISDKGVPFIFPSRSWGKSHYQVSPLVLVMWPISYSLNNVFYPDFVDTPVSDGRDDDINSMGIGPVPHVLPFTLLDLFEIQYKYSSLHLPPY